MAGLAGQARLPKTADPRERRNAASLASSVPFIATSGSGIGLSGTGTLLLVFATGAPFTQTVGLGLTLTANGGLAVAASALGILKPTVSGLQLDATGLWVKLDSAPGLTLSATGLKILLDSAPGLQLTSGLKVLLDSAPGLQLTSGLKVLVNTGTHITLGAGGVGTDGTAANTASTLVARGAAGEFSCGVVTSTGLVLGTAGNGIKVKEGANATMGLATLVAGAVTVATTVVTASSRIFLTVNGVGVLANLGSPYEDTASRAAGTSFTIKSTNALDTSNIAWLLVEPA